MHPTILKNLEELYKTYSAYLSENPFTGNPDNLYDPMNYIMNLGGKRARPMLTMAAALSAGGDSSAVLPVAHTMEVFHNFSLVHDDIMDRAPSRRGQPTVHLKWDMPTAILAGDNMLVAAYRLLFGYTGQGKEAIVSLFTDTATGVCEGQQWDMDFANMEHVNEAAYLEMIRLKTAVLLGCCAGSGALSAGASKDIAMQYYQFAVAVGMAFQLHDDWLDTFGDPNKTGKKPGGDIGEGKKTWLYIAAEQMGLPIANLYKEKQDEARIEAATALFTEAGLDTRLLQLAATYNEEANQLLQDLQNKGHQTQWLEELVAFLSNREH